MLGTLHELEYWVYKKRRLLYSGKQKCNSYLKNWANLLSAWFQATTKTIVLEDGTSVSLGYYERKSDWCNGGSIYGEFGLLLNAGDNDATYGLVVGRGTTPVSESDYKLADKYPHGSGGGYLDYDITKISDVVSEDGKLKISVERAFYNDYGDSQDITEVGLMVFWKAELPDYGKQYYKFLIMRDVLDNVLTIPAYATAVVRYNIYFLVG